MIHVEIREQLRASDGANRFIDRRLFPAVPAVGELLNYAGHPYIIIRRDWAMSEDGPELWCYLIVLPATPFAISKRED